MKLRDYQVTAIENLRGAIREGRRRIILCAATGSGKTVTIAAMIAAAVAKGRTALFICHRRELVNQAAAKLTDYGVAHGVLMATDKRTNHSAPVQIASVQTLASRLRRAVIHPPPADLLIVDEAHHATATTWRKIIDHYSKAPVIGLTATPARKNGDPLSDIFQAIVPCSSYAELTAQGFLVPCRVWAPSTPDLRGVRTKAGDYDEKQLASRMDRTTIIGDVVKHWLEHGERRPTLVYGVTIDHSKHLCEQFVAAGIAADHIDGQMAAFDRDQVLTKFQDGGLEVLCNCMVLTEGTDIPRASCIVNARPTKSLVLYRQIAGRGMRPHPGKADCYIFDHAGAWELHGLPNEDIAWSLDERTKSKPAVDKETGEARMVHCRACHAIYSATESVCPSCGEPRPARKPRIPKQAPGTLLEVRSVQASRAFTLTGMQRAWDSLVWQAAKRGLPMKVPSVRFKRQFGRYPNKVSGLLRTCGYEDAETPAAEFVRT